MLHRTLAVCCVFLFLTSASNRVFAQPIFSSTESIELTVANSEIVVIGKITAIGDILPESVAEERLLTISVETTLKGRHQNEYPVLTTMRPERLTPWLEGQSRLLLATGGGRKTETRFVDLTRGKVQVLTADEKLLRDPQEVICVAQETVLRLPGVNQIEQFQIMLSGNPYPQTSWSTSSGVLLYVPVDDRLQQRAQQWLETNDYTRRLEAAHALRYFKTDDNVKRITALLKDDNWSYLKHPDQNEGIEVRHYGLRERAYQTLLYWGVQVKPPVIEEERLIPGSKAAPKPNK